MNTLLKYFFYFSIRSFGKYVLAFGEKINDVISKCKKNKPHKIPEK